MNGFVRGLRLMKRLPSVALLGQSFYAGHWMQRRNPWRGKFFRTRNPFYPWMLFLLPVYSIRQDGVPEVWRIA